MANKLRPANEEEVTKVIEDLVKQFPFYGYRKITAVLRMKMGENVNRKRVYRIMKERTLLMPASHSHKKLSCKKASSILT